MNNSSETRLNNIAKEYLRETAKWTNFLSIIGFIGIGLIVLIALFAGTIFSSLPNEGGFIGGAMITVIYLVLAALYFFPILYLYRFSTKLKYSLGKNDEDELTSAFENLKSHYKFMGILMIVMLSFYAIGILFAIIGGVASLAM